MSTFPQYEIMHFNCFKCYISYGALENSENKVFKWFEIVLRAKNRLHGRQMPFKAFRIWCCKVTPGVWGNKTNLKVTFN